MAFPDLFTQTQLEYALGGADNLRKLVDKSNTGLLSDATCQALIAEIGRAASGEVYSIIQVGFDPSDETVTGADFIIQSALPIAAYWAWVKSTGGMAVPDEIKAARQQARKDLKEAAEGFRALGTSTDPTSNAGASMVTIDTDGTRVVRGNMGGFC